MVLFKEKVDWTSEVKALLAPAMASDELNTILAIEKDVLVGTCQVVAGYEDDNLVIAFVIRVDKEELGNELVVVCGASLGHGNTIKCMPEFQRLAHKYNCDYIRIHTKLKALGRILQHNGYTISEIVARQRV